MAVCTFLAISTEIFPSRYGKINAHTSIHSMDHYVQSWNCMKVCTLIFSICLPFLDLNYNFVYSCGFTILPYIPWKTKQTWNCMKVCTLIFSICLPFLDLNYNFIYSCGFTVSNDHTSIHSMENKTNMELHASVFTTYH